MGYLSIPIHFCIHLQYFKVENAGFSRETNIFYVRRENMLTKILFAKTWKPQVPGYQGGKSIGAEFILKMLNDKNYAGRPFV